MDKEIEHLLNFWRKHRHCFSLANGDVPHKEAAWFIEQLGVYMSVLAIAKLDRDMDKK